MSGRLILDVSSLLRWSGPAVGIARVEHALAMAALARPGAVLACSDADGFQTLDPAWRDVLLGWSGVLDRHQRSAGWRGLVPGRQGIVGALERVRLTTAWPPGARLAALLQRAVLSVRPHQFPLHGAEGERIANVPRDLGLGAIVAFGPGDTLFSAGNGWSGIDPARIGALKRRHGFRYCVLCYDLIPITHERFYEADVAAAVRAYWRDVLPLVDRVIVNAEAIGADLRRFCAVNAIPPPQTVVLPLGFDPPPAHAGAGLPGGLEAGRYALFVSTIEPRKGHAMLMRAWRRLLAQGGPQRAGFRLVFVGRPGWMVADTLRNIAAEATVVHLPQASDAVLDALYAGAAFCLYPSEYEGYGLPVIEAFARGVPLLASSGGAVAETAAGFAPCLDPLDDAAWAAAIGSWIDDPAALVPYRERLRAFEHPAWPAAANRIIDAVLAS